MTVRRLRNGAKVFYLGKGSEDGPALPAVDHWQGVPDSERMTETVELAGGTVLTTFLGTPEEDGAMRRRRTRASTPVPAAPPPLPPSPSIVEGEVDEDGRWRFGKVKPN